VAPAQADLTEVGRAAAVNQLSEGTPPGEETRRLLIGTDVFFEERIVTSGEGQTQILFTDESSLTVGPNAEIVIDSYVFDPNTGDGEISMNLIDGALRYVGGRISKGGGVSLQTPTATIGIRGGINITRHDDAEGVTRSSNVFGNQTVTRDEATEILQKGWTVEIGREGGFDFFRSDASQFLALNQSFEGDGTGGAEEQPTSDQAADAGIDRDNSELPPQLAESTARARLNPASAADRSGQGPDAQQIDEAADTTENAQDVSTGDPIVEDPEPRDPNGAIGTALVNGLGGPSGFGTEMVGGEFGGRGTDDGSSPELDITPVFEEGLDFGGVRYDGLFVNNNGNVTFGRALGAFTPFPLDGSAPTPIIAPFFADVDTTIGAVAPTPGGTSTGSNLVWYAVDPETDTVTATWDDVGYFPDRTDKLNAFQLQLVDLGDGNYDIVFRYEDINWTTGGASGGEDGLGGEVARVGFSATDGGASFEPEGSGNQEAMLNLLTGDSNTGQPGLYRIEIRDQRDRCDCAFLNWSTWATNLTDAQESPDDVPQFGSWVGGPQPDLDQLPVERVAVYEGAAVGRVVNGDVVYRASGRFTNTWDFAARSGSIAIDDFDGRDLSGTATAGNGRDYSGDLAGSGLTGELEGSFFGGGDDPVAETGGGFELRGDGYRADGTFGARAVQPGPVDGGGATAGQQ
jgi:hypothetical protein